MGIVFIMLSEDIRKVVKTALKSFYAKTNISYKDSWSYSVEGFEKAYEYLAQPLEMFDSGEKIWQTSSKSVWKVTLPEELGGLTVAVKKARAKKVLTYLFRKTPSAQEAVNYVILEALGLPMAKFLAVSDERKFFRWQESTFVTQFADNVADGRLFMTDGDEVNNHDLKSQFILMNLKYIAYLHSIYFFHKGFKPYNILWSKSPEQDKLVLTWIDVSTCRFCSKKGFNKRIIHDLKDFLNRLNLSEDELGKFIAYYRDYNSNCKMSVDEIAVSLKR